MNSGVGWERNSSKNYWELLLLSDGCGYVGIAHCGPRDAGRNLLQQLLGCGTDN